jgi:hypothetical protein
MSPTLPKLPVAFVRRHSRSSDRYNEVCFLAQRKTGLSTWCAFRTPHRTVSLVDNTKRVRSGSPLGQGQAPAVLDDWSSNNTKAPKTLPLLRPALEARAEPALGPKLRCMQTLASAMEPLAPIRGPWSIQGGLSSARFYDLTMHGPLVREARHTFSNPSRLEA